MTHPIVSAFCAGQPVPFRNGELSAFAKHPVDGPVHIGFLGLGGDAQADRKHHGGPDMAVHLYPRDHIPFWRERLGAHSLLNDPGAFGTNLAVEGLTEDHVRIGDRFRLGEALIEVSQPRKPCWKIEHRFGHAEMVAAIIAGGRCGWYFRVIEEGMAQAGDVMELIAGSGTQWSVAEAFAAIVGPTGKTTPRDTFAALADCPQLSADWRQKAAVRAAK